MPAGPWACWRPMRKKGMVNTAMGFDFIWAALFRPLCVGIVYMLVLLSMCGNSKNKHTKGQERPETEVIDAEYRQIK